MIIFIDKTLVKKKRGKSKKVLSEWINILRLLNQFDFLYNSHILYLFYLINILVELNLRFF